MLHERSRELVEDDQLAAPRSDGEAIVAEHPVDLVGAQPGRVHQIARAQRTARRGEPKAGGLEPLDGRDGSRSAQVAAGQHRLGRVGERGGERADEPLVGHLERAVRARPEMRLSPVQLVDPHLGDRVVAVRVRALHDARELGELLLVPGHEQRARLLDRDPHPRGVLGEQLEAAHHEPRLQRARLGVVAGVEQRGVRLARAGADVGAGLEQRHTQIELRQLAGNRAAHDTRTDDGDVRVERLLHGPQYRRRHDRSARITECCQTTCRGCAVPDADAGGACAPTISSLAATL